MCVASGRVSSARIRKSRRLAPLSCLAMIVRSRNVRHHRPAGSGSVSSSMASPGLHGSTATRYPSPTEPDSQPTPREHRDGKHRDRAPSHRRSLAMAKIIVMRIDAEPTLMARAPVPRRRRATPREPVSCKPRMETDSDQTLVRDPNDPARRVRRRTAPSRGSCTRVAGPSHSPSMYQPSTTSFLNLATGIPSRLKVK